MLLVEDETLRPDVSGALYWPREETLIVADLHLEKGSAFAARGQFLPPYDTAATLRRLDEACARLSPKRVIALGDSFHDRAAEERLSAPDHATLARRIAAQEWVWVLGNHDPQPPKSLGGLVAEEIAIGALTFRHEPIEAPASGEIAGHLHPVASIRARGRRLRRRCFATDGARLVMPAFGAYAGGLDVLDAAFAPVFRGGFDVWMMGQAGVYRFAHAHLVPDAA